MTNSKKIKKNTSVKAAAGLLAITAMATGAVSLGSGNASAATGETTFKAYTTAYDYWDNTPRGSVEISDPQVHQYAGGSGTYNDPITLAVGHQYLNGKDILDYPAGTKFYIPALQKYFIVEDTCGDGDDGSINGCHVGYKEGGVKYPWLDMWVGGKSLSESAASACMDKVTAVHTVIQNPANDYKVTAGEIASGGCSTFSDTPVKVSGTTPTPSPTTSIPAPSTTTSPATGTLGTKAFTANADTYVDSSNANTNYGKSTTLGADASPTKRTYMSFPVSGVNGKTVTAAKLRFYVTDASAHEQNFVKTTGSWSESGTTYNNRPGTDSTPSASKYGMKVGWNEVSIPVSDIKSDGVYNYGIHPHDSGDTDGLDIASRESGANAPQLIVTTK